MYTVCSHKHVDNLNAQLDGLAWTCLHISTHVSMHACRYNARSETACKVPVRISRPHKDNAGEGGDGTCTGTNSIGLLVDSDHCLCAF